MKTLFAFLLLAATAALAQETNATIWVVVHHSADTIVLRRVTRELPPVPTQVPAPWTANLVPVTNGVSIAPVVGMVPGIIPPQAKFHAAHELETNTTTGVIRSKRLPQDPQRKKRKRQQNQ